MARKHTSKDSQSGSDDQNVPFRIADLNDAPSLSDLYQALEGSKTDLGRQMELVWKLGPTGGVYTLRVGCPKDQGTPPDWVLIMPDGNAAWSYLGDDVALIHVHVRNLAGATGTKSSATTFPDFSFPALNSGPGPFPFEAAVAVKVATLDLPEEAPFLAPIANDFATLRRYHELLLQPETGIMTQWWMMFFLEQEYYRFKATNFPVTLAVFDLTMRTASGLAPLSISHVKQIGQRITSAKRKIDQFGHFGSTLYALLLPHTDLAAGTKVAERIKTIITEDANSRGWDNSKIVLRLGIAAIIPKDNAKDLNALILEAVENLK